jgi:hypothetical protein
MLAFWQGTDEEACSLHGRSLQLARRLGHPTVTALALCGLARVAWAKTWTGRGRCASRRSRRFRTPTRAPDAPMRCRWWGVAAQMRGDLRQARDLMTRRIDLARELGDCAAVGGESANLSMVERQLGNLAHAERLAREALQIAERRGDEWLIRAGGHAAGRSRRAGEAAGERVAAGRGAALRAQPRGWSRPNRPA